MTKLTSPKWTIVQHSAYVRKGDGTFATGIEARQISTTDEVGRIIDAGGLVFDTWAAADDFENKEPYPEGYTGIIPRVPGTFHPTLRLDGMPIYLPHRKEA